MSTLLEMRIEELEEQNAALVAQVEALRVACLDWENIETPNAWGLIFEEIKRCANTKPQHHLRQVRADAGRNGFVEKIDALQRHAEKFNEINGAIDAARWKCKLDSLICGMRNI